MTWLKIAVTSIRLHCAWFHLSVHCIDFAKAWITVRDSWSDFAMGIKSLQSGFLCLHVQCVVHLIVNSKFLIKLSGSISLEPREHGCLVLIKLGESHFLNRPTGHSHIVSDNVMFGPQVLPLDTPTVLAWHTRYWVDNCGFVINCRLLRAHLVR